MTKQQLERLSDLLIKFFEEEAEDGGVRDKVSQVRWAVNEKLEQRGGF